MEVFLFANGNTGVLEDSRQRTELQTPWMILVLERLEAQGIDPLTCKFQLPGGAAAEPFRTSDGGWNWRVL